MDLKLQLKASATAEKRGIKTQKTPGLSRIGLTGDVLIQITKTVERSARIVSPRRGGDLGAHKISFGANCGRRTNSAYGSGDKRTQQHAATA